MGKPALLTRCNQTDPFAKFLKNIDLNKRLLMEPFLVSDDFDGNENAEFMVNTPHYLSKTSLAENIYNFVSVREVVTGNNGVVSSLIVVPKVWCIRLQIANDLACILRSAEVDVVVIDYLATLIHVQHGDPNGILRTDAFFGGCPLLQGIQCFASNLGLLSSGAQLPHLFLAGPVILVQLRGPASDSLEGSR